MKRPLRAQHEKFAKLVALGVSQAKAYRTAVSPQAAAETAWKLGSRLAVKVRWRIEELTSAAQGRACDQLVYRWEQAMEELEGTRQKAMAKGDYSAAIRAICQKCKISGLEVDPRANAQRPFEGVTDEELEERIEATKKEIEVAKALRH